MSSDYAPTPVEDFLDPDECTRPGVFAIGDVRIGSTKRVAAAIGDGALVVRSIHASLDPRRA